MGKIFCLMGKSSTGKDTIFEALKNDRVLNLKPIVPYTTRPQRTNELDGEAYYFIDIEKLEHYTREGKVIEQRCYKTINGNWYYATIDDGQIDLNNNNYIVIVTLEAYSNLLKYFNMENIIPIYIEVEDGLRLERALSREKQQIQPNYDELCRRFLADNKDFSEERLNINRITKRYQNLNLDQCIKEIKDRIRTIS
ncbi:guanylate kinase [Cellulosilyticum sp. ST5]|uniref:guanylate kinase n=1 Tax=unclassified Cellulosilyticum TaxID=2643091 RepID=UPI000F8CBD78|nr:guanylate kinase [Cellulosilyticum sp. WCF-2]QEH67444.1 guanylate kinase [Cellulosilyticum sp. WCF-2]